MDLITPCLGGSAANKAFTDVPLQPYLCLEKEQRARGLGRGSASNDDSGNRLWPANRMPITGTRRD